MARHSENKALTKQKFYFSGENTSTAMPMWMLGKHEELNKYQIIFEFYFHYSDPVQLNLLYEQAKEAILDGTHPVPLETAIQFAALQVQIQFGDHKEDKHKPGMLAE